MIIFSILPVLQLKEIDAKMNFKQPRDKNNSKPTLSSGKI